MNWDGGFMNDSIADEPQQVANSVTVTGEEKVKAVAAVSVSQIVKLTRPNEGLMIHNKKIYHINLVAMVSEIIDVNSTKVHVLLDDYTGGGPIEMTCILGGHDLGGDSNLSMFNDNPPASSEGESRELSSIRQGDYLRIIGVAKYNSDKPTVVGYNVRIIEDPNEVTVHRLEVIRDSLYFERNQKGRSEPTGGMGAPQNYQQAASKNDNFGNFPTREKHILKFLVEKAPGKGVTLDEIAANFKAFKREEIKESLSVLNSEGQCWQGDDEDVWRVD